MPSSTPSAEQNTQLILGIIVIALLVIGLGLWAWRATIPSPGYSELFWVSAPKLVDESMVFSIRLNSYESQDLRWDINAYVHETLLERKKVQLGQGQNKQVDFAIPFTQLQNNNYEIVILAQRFDGLGNAVKQPLEIRDWLRVDVNAN